MVQQPLTCPPADISADDDCQRQRQTQSQDSTTTASSSTSTSTSTSSSGNTTNTTTAAGTSSSATAGTDVSACVSGHPRQSEATGPDFHHRDIHSTTGVPTATIATTSTTSTAPTVTASAAFHLHTPSPYTDTASPWLSTPAGRLRDERATIASMAASSASESRESRLPSPRQQQPQPQPQHPQLNPPPPPPIPSSIPPVAPLPPIQPRQDPVGDHRLPSWPHSPRSSMSGMPGMSGINMSSMSSMSNINMSNIMSSHLPPPPPPPPPPAPPSALPRLPSASSLAYPGSPSFPPPSALDPDPRDHHRHHHVYSSSSHNGHMGVSVADLYRSSPGSSVPPQLSPHLPSMRTLDALPPPPPSQHGLTMPGPSMGMPNAPLPYMAMAPPSYGLGPHSLPPFGLPGHPRDFQGLRMTPLGMGTISRHKKEIKRRTKTGCMTCRRRRIKCDEAHPTCNNCKKSKRECAGYDPIFKQQPLSPHPLQPTTSSTTTTLATANATTAGAAHSSAANTTAGSSESAATSTSAGTPTLSPIPITPTAAAAVAAAAAATASTASTLAAVKSPAAAAASLSLHSPATSSPATIPNLYTSTAASSSSTSASSASLNAAAAAVAAAYNPTAYSPRSLLSPTHDWDWGASGVVYRANMKVDEIISLAGPVPAAPTSPPTLEMLDDITKMYYEIYVPGLTNFFETSWYNFKPNGTVNPVSNLLNNKALVGLLSAFLGTVARVETTDSSEAEMAAASALETRVVWALAGMAYITPATVNLPSDEPVASDNAIEARNRLAVVDALLSGGCVRTNPCMPPPRAGNPQRVREHQFWWWLAEYLRLQDESGLNNTPGNSLPRLREQALGRMRSLLDGLENRDVIYSIAILRHLSSRYPQAAGDVIVPPGHEDEADPRIKLAMAIEFIRKEAQGLGGHGSGGSGSTSGPGGGPGGGLTNVVRRFAELGLKAFVQPGYNIRRA